jgi:hypothetical protein
VPKGEKILFTKIELKGEDNVVGEKNVVHKIDSKRGELIKEWDQLKF